MSSSMDNVIENEQQQTGNVEGTALQQEGMQTPDTRARGSFFSPFQVRNFQLLFAGQTISTLGDTFYAVALPWLVLTTGGNPQELGIILTAYGLPRIGTVLLGGVLSDKLRPRRVMLLADTVRAVLVGMLAMLGILGHPVFWQLLAVAIPLGAFEGLFLPASFAILPDILDDATLQAGNSLNFSSTQLATLVGSGVAGIIVGAVGSGVALAIDAGTFVVSAVSLTAMRLKKTVAATSTTDMTVETTASTEEAATGESEPAPGFWQILRGSALVQVAFVVAVIANLTFGGMVEVALPVLAHSSLNAGATGFGLMLSAFGAGALIGSIATGMLSRLRHRGIISLLAALAQALAVALIPFSGGLIGAMLCLFLMGFMNSITNVLFITLMQENLPRAQLGRFMGIILFASFGSYPISVLLAGILVTHTGPAFMFPISGAFLALGAAFGLSQREIRKL
ncbi:MAG TPA: MFS transporter [Ktedonobacteraceae bacterium]|nr:MFS transporter [Ktedonobacteraceae bacterium]